MKKRSFLIAFLLIITACSKEEIKFELFSAEAFAYSLDSGFELNARTMAKGFKLEETGGLFKAKLTYTADLVMPDKTVKKDFAAGSFEKEEKNEFTEAELSIQKELDSKYSLGIYKVVFNVTDEISKQKLSIEKDFELSN